MNSIVLIGAGNLATQLAKRFIEVGVSIAQIYSRTEESAQALAKIVGASWTTNTVDIVVADAYIIALSDKAFSDVLPYISFNDSLIMHTAGSVPIDLLANYSDNYGVLYPLQTFSKLRDVDFSDIPICIEANRDDNLVAIEKLANKLSHDVRIISSEQRKFLHLAAIFCCNFVNHMYDICDDITTQNGVQFDILRPLIQETAAKIEQMSPRKAQTGPAVRFDTNVIDAHLKELSSDSDIQELYSLLSKSINRFQNK